MLRKPDLSSFSLHLLAMGLMLCDHLWATIIPGNSWMTWLGRLSFPIFAFLVAEGYGHTRSYPRYVRRMLLFALLAELPFNLMYTGSWIFPFHQNVLWTFLISLAAIHQIDRFRTKFPSWLAILLGSLVAAAACLCAMLTMTDYGGYGVATVLLFYLFPGRNWKMRTCQLIGMYWIHWELMGSMTVPVSLLGMTVELPQQGASILALIPIWCYQGRQGYHSKFSQYSFYAFYPLHMLILGLLSQ